MYNILSMSIVRLLYFIHGAIQVLNVPALVDAGLIEQSQGDKFSTAIAELASIATAAPAVPASAIYC